MSVLRAAAPVRILAKGTVSMRAKPRKLSADGSTDLCVGTSTRIAHLAPLGFLTTQTPFAMTVEGPEVKCIGAQNSLSLTRERVRVWVSARSKTAAGHEFLRKPPRAWCQCERSRGITGRLGVPMLPWALPPTLLTISTAGFSLCANWVRNDNGAAD